MNRSISILATALCVAMIVAPAEAKKAAKPAADGQAQGKQQGQGEEADKSKDNGGIPRYVPFPHDRNFVLKEINGKAPPVDMWINIDSTGRANGFSGCKTWSGVFAIGPERLGPRAMPAINERQCDGALAGLEREYWGVLLSGPYWEVQGDDLTLKGFKGGVLKFQRSL